jgi:hypothetical protein
MQPGKPVFSLLKNGATDVYFYAFDVLMVGGEMGRASRS